MASSSGTRLQAGLSCGSTRRILTLFRFFHHLHDTTRIVASIILFWGPILFLIAVLLFMIWLFNWGAN
jgi:hypothetical protein